MMKKDICKYYTKEEYDKLNEKEKRIKDGNYETHIRLNNLKNGPKDRTRKMLWMDDFKHPKYIKYIKSEYDYYRRRVSLDMIALNAGKTCKYHGHVFYPKAKSDTSGLVEVSKCKTCKELDNDEFY